MKRTMKFALMVFAGAVSYCGKLESAWADSNPWAGEVSEARSVQSKTEDIAERLSEKYPFSAATHPALALDQLANQLESSLKCGASWQQIQSLLQQTCITSQHVHQLVSADCHARADRRLMGYFPELDKRLAELDHELLERRQKLSVPVCAPKVPVHVLPPNAVGIVGNDPFGDIRHADGRRVAPQTHPHASQYPSRDSGWNNPWNMQTPRDVPFGYQGQPESVVPSYPVERDPSGFDVYEQSPMLPPGSTIGPIRYRPATPMVPSNVVPIGQSRYGAPAQQQTVGRQVLSTVLLEIANRL